MGVRALLVGINAYPTAPLRGCINDIEAIHKLLNDLYDVPADGIRMLKDSQATTANIRAGLAWLAQPDDDGAPPIRLFHFSGHGVYAPDDNGDEPDGQDECLVPFDHVAAGPLRDDALRQIYDSFGQETHLLLIMDCCHSGSNQRDEPRDLLFRFLPLDDEQRQQIAARRKTYERAHSQPLSPERMVDELEALQQRGASPAEIDEWLRKAWTPKRAFGADPDHDFVVHLAACQDNQTAADAGFGGTYHGALTYYLLAALRRDPAIRYGDLLDALAADLGRNKFSQVPRLNAGDARRALPFLSLRR